MSGHKTKPALMKKGTRRKPRKHGPGKHPYFYLALFACVAILIFLSFYIPTAHVRLVVNTTHVEFNSSASDLEKLMRAFDTKLIQISSAVRLTLGYGSVRLQSQPLIEAQDAFVDMPEANASVTISGPSVARIQFSNETKYRVSLGWLESSPNVIQVAFRPAETVVLSPFKDLAITCDYCSLRGLQHADVPGPLAFCFSSHETQGHEVSLALRDGRFNGAVSLSSLGPFAQNGIPVQDAPRFQRADGDRIRSAILGGEIMVTGVDGAIGHKLGPSATISLTGIKDFKIEEIRIEDSLKVTGSGEVGSLLISGQNVLPSLIHSKWEMMTAVATVFLIFATLFKEFKK